MKMLCTRKDYENIFFEDVKNQTTSTLKLNVFLLVFLVYNYLINIRDTDSNFSSISFYCVCVYKSPWPTVKCVVSKNCEVTFFVPKVLLLFCMTFASPHRVPIASLLRMWKPVFRFLLLRAFNRSGPNKSSSFECRVSYSVGASTSVVSTFSSACLFLKSAKNREIWLA